MGRPLWEAALGSSRVPTWQSFSDERKVESRNEKSLESTRPLPDIGPSSSRCSAKSNNDVVSWSGEDDLENPQKFRLVVKCLIGIVIGLMNFVVSLAISLFTGILDVSGREFHQSIDRMQLALTLYILGLAFGPVFFGPASEFYGRKRPLIFGMIGFVLFTGLCTTRTSMTGLLTCRFLAGLCGSSAYAIPPGIFVDLFGPVGRVIGYQIFATGAFIGGSLGPAVGVCMVKHGLEWRWTMYLTNALAIPLIAASAVLPESLAPVILQRKSRRLRLETGNWALHCRRDEMPVQLKNYLIKPCKMLVQEPVLMGVTAAFTLGYSIQSLTYSEVPHAFTMRGWSPAQASSALALTIPGFVLGCFIVVGDTKLRFQRNLSHGILIAPESRLPPIIVGMALLAGGLLWFAWTCSHNIPWGVQALAEVFLGCGMYIVWVTATVYAQELYVSHSNSALAACAFVRYSLGAASPLLSSPLRVHLGLPWALSSLGLMCAFLVPVHVMFYLFGYRVRAWSKFAMHEETP